MNNSSISANTLFHFTKTIDNLESILRRGFEPNYSLENMESVLDDFQIAIPMVSFCDIPLSQIHNHVDTYGCYALGLSKNWGKKKRINPVLYTYKGAAIANHIKSFLDKITLDKITNDPNDDVIVPVRDFFNFIKLYEGVLPQKDKKGGKILFYDEREWRYVPIIDDEDGITPFLRKESFFDERLKGIETEKLHRKKLSFTPNYIRYIIVSKESEILDMSKRIKQIKAKFTEDEVDKLITRIISIEFINEDF